MSSFCNLSIWDFADTKANFHTHTARCGHAVGTDREYVEKAIEAGYKVLGFSDHGPMLRTDGFESRVRMKPDELEGYVSSIEVLRREYQKDISLYIGLEIENMPGCFDRTLDFYRQFPIDYLILGQHFLGDEGSGAYVARPTEDAQYLSRYVELVSEALDTDLFLYVAHPDILYFTGDRNVYREYMEKLLNKLKERNRPVEVNGNGFLGCRHYPDASFAKMAAENGNTFVVGVDAHDPLNLTDYRINEGCVSFVGNVGGRIICQ